MLDLENNVIKSPRALVCKIVNGQRFFLLVKEPGGFYTIPGGCKEIEDVDVLSAIKRELEEELSLTEKDYEIHKTDIQKRYKNLYSDVTSERFGKDTVIDLFVVQCVNEKAIQASNEISSTVWLNETEVVEALNANHFKEIFQLGTKALN